MSSAVPYFPPPPKSSLKPATRWRKTPDPDSKPPRYLRRSRLILLPLLLILAFITTVISLIYAYCIAASHTRLSAEELANDIERNDSYFGRMLRLARRDAGSSSDEDRPVPIAMIFYSLTAPLVTLVYIIAELWHHITRPHISVTRRAHHCYLLLTLAQAAGWVANNAFWAHCEIPAPSLTANMQLCPASVRGHFMFGIHVLSIAKIATGFLIVLGLGVHACCIVKNMRDIRRYGGEGLGIKHGSARMVLEMEEGARVQKHLKRGFKKQGVRIASPATSV
jgi:hypothetical protein